MKVGQIFAELGLDDRKFNSGLDRAEGKAKTAGKNIGGAFANAFSIAAGIGVAQLVQKAFDGLRSVFIGFNADMEQAKIGFTTMLNSADAAGVMIERLGKFVAETPFEFPQVQAAARKLLAFGWAANDIIPTLTAVGNAASGLGLGAEGINRITMAIGQMKAKGKVSAEELLQLAEAGVPAYDILAKKLNLTGKEVADIGNQGIEADKAIKALLEGMNERFPDMMKAQSESARGLFSTIKDNTVLMISALSQDAFSGLKSSLSDFKNFTDKVFVPIKDGGLQALFKFGPEAEASIRTVKELGSAIGSMDGDIRSLKETPIIPPEWNLSIKTVFNAFYSLGQTVLTVCSEIASTVMSAFDGSGSSINKWVPILERVSSALIILFGGAVRVVIQLLSAFIDVVEWVADTFVWMVQGIADGAGLLANDLNEAFNWIRENLGLVGDAFGEAGDFISNLWSDMARWVVEKTSELVRGVLEALGPIGKMVKTVGSALGDAWNALTGPKTDAFGQWAARSKKATFDMKKGIDDLANHQGQKTTEMGDKGSKAADKMAKDARHVSEAIEKEWYNVTQTLLAQAERWYEDHLEKLNESKAANENYERDFLRLKEVYAKKRADIEKQQAESVASYMRDIVGGKDTTTKANVEFGYTGAQKGFADIENEKMARIKAIDEATAKGKLAEDALITKYGEGAVQRFNWDQWLAQQKDLINQQTEQKRMMYIQSGQALEDQLNADRQAADFTAYTQHLTNKNAAFLSYLEGERAMMDLYRQIQMDANITWSNAMAQVGKSAYSGLSNALYDMMTGAKTVSQAFADMGKAILQTIARILANWIAARIAQAIFGKTTLAGEIAVGTAAAGALAAAWSSAAAMVSLATFGANSAPAIAGMTAATGVALGLAIPKLAAGGITTGPTLAMIGEGKYDEAVVPLDKDRLSKLGFGGGDSQPLVIHYSPTVKAWDSRDASRALKENASVMIEIIESETRRFNYGRREG